MLRLEGIGCSTASSGERALELVKERIRKYVDSNGEEQVLYKLILLDFSMPGMDGPEVSRRIHKMYAESEVVSKEQVPYICCCTAYTEDSFK